MKTEDILAHLEHTGKAISDEARDTEVFAEQNHGDSFHLGYAEGMIDALRMLNDSLERIGFKVEVFATRAGGVTERAVNLAEYTALDASLWRDFGADAVGLLSRVSEYISFADSPHIAHDDWCEPFSATGCACGLEDLIEEIREYFEKCESDD